MKKNRAEINGKETKETMGGGSKSWFFEQIDKIDKLSQTHQEKKGGEGNLINKVRNENGEITATQKYKGS